MEWIFFRKNENLRETFSIFSFGLYEIHKHCLTSKIVYVCESTETQTHFHMNFFPGDDDDGVVVCRRRRSIFLVIHFLCALQNSNVSLYISFQNENKQSDEIFTEIQFRLIPIDPKISFHRKFWCYFLFQLEFLSSKNYSFSWQIPLIYFHS